jgi:hypothetical protein
MEPRKNTPVLQENALGSIVASKKRSWIELRGEEIRVDECVVCPSLLGVASRTKIPKSFLRNFLIDDLPKVFCCSKRCSFLFVGQKIEREKAQNVKHRLDAWVTSLLGSSVRVGSPAVLLRDTSANRLVEAGDGVIVAVSFDRLLQAGVFKVRRVLDGRTHEVTSTGFRSPGAESGLPQRTSKKPRVTNSTSNEPSLLESANRFVEAGDEVVSAERFDRCASWSQQTCFGPSWR